MLFSETKTIKELSKRVEEIFYKRGYGEVVTPGLEYYDVFNFENQVIPEENMFKLTDTTGKLAVLRPDNTTPIARIVSSRLKNAPMPIKLYYNQNVFRISRDYSGKRSEFLQTGIEIIGGDTLRSDMECVLCALSALNEIRDYFGGKLSFKLEIGHVGYYKALIEQMNLSEEDAEKVRKYVEAKNSFSSGLFDIEGSENLRTIQKIPTLFGTGEVFSKARIIAGENIKALGALSYLNDIYNNLCIAGYANDITVDLAIAHSIEYYTGFVFRAYFEYAGEPILSGGRYDMLLQNFDMSKGATGFGINLSLISDAAEKRGLGKREKPPKILIYFEMPYLKKAIDYAKKRDEVLEFSSFEDYTAALEYARAKGIETIVAVGKEIKEIKLSEAKD